MQLSNSTPNSLLFSTQNILRLPIHYPLGSKGRAVPRVVCCAIPIARAAGKVLVVTSRKQPNNWLCKSPPFYYITLYLILSSLHAVPKGGWEPSDVELESAASREALEEGPNLYHFSSSHFLTMVYPFSSHSTTISLNSWCTRYHYTICGHNINTFNHGTFL